MNTSARLSTSQKGNSLIYVLLGVLILVAVIFFIAGGTSYMMLHMGNSQPVSEVTTIPTPNISENWQLYHTQYYSIKYPPSWHVINADPKIPGHQEAYDPSSLQQGTQNGGSPITRATEYIMITTIISPETPTQYIDQITTKNPAYNGIQVIKDPIIINGMSATVFNESGEGATGYNIVLSNGSLLVVINIPVLDPTSDQTINQILSTFTFTTPSPTLVTQQSCNISSDCPSGSTCETKGPIVDTPKRVCVPKGQMVPLSQQ